MIRMRSTRAIRTGKLFSTAARLLTIEDAYALIRTFWSK
jgi:hypothetical protein